jgi:uncharacterized protein
VSVSLFLGVLVGAVLGLTGAGGGILAVPALVAGLGWSVQQAAPVALIAVAVGAALGAVEGFRRGLVRYRAAFLMVLAGLPLTSVGLHIAARVPQSVLLVLFALVMLVVATRLLLASRTATHIERPRPPVLARIDPASGRFRWTWASGLIFAGIGALAGFLTGLLGVGGGFVIVPGLRRFTDVSMHGVVATSLMVVALVSAGGVAVALAGGAPMPIQTTLFFALSTAIGMLLGRRLASRISESSVQRGFSVLVLIVAMGLLLEATRR